MEPVVKFMHIEHCRLSHTLSDIKNQELAEERYVLWPATRGYGMSSNPVSSSFTEQNRVGKKNKNKSKKNPTNLKTLSTPNHMQPEIQSRLLGKNS